MKHFLKKLFYIDSPAHGALFSTVLFLIGSWILLSWAVLLGGFSPDCPGLLRENGGCVWKIYGIIELVLFFYLLMPIITSCEINILQNYVPFRTGGKK